MDQKNDIPLNDDILVSKEHDKWRKNIQKKIDMLKNQVNAVLESSPRRFLDQDASAELRLNTKQKEFVNKINGIKEYWHSKDCKIENSTSKIKDNSKESTNYSDHEDRYDNGNSRVPSKSQDYDSENSLDEMLDITINERCKPDNESSSKSTFTDIVFESPRASVQNSTLDSSSYLTAICAEIEDVNKTNSVEMESLYDADDITETESVFSVGLAIDTESIISATETQSVLDPDDFSTDTEYSERPSDDESINENLPVAVTRLEKVFDKVFSNYFSKNSFGFKERPQIDQKKVAIAFMRHLVLNQLINIDSQLTEEELITLYENFLVDHSNSSVNKSEILVVLKSINVIKRKGFADNKNNLIGFKEYVFLSYDEDFNETNSSFKNKVKIHYLNNEEDLIFEKALFKCAMCKQVCTSQTDLDEHNRSKIHILKKIYRQDRSWFSNELNHLNVNDIPKMTLDINEEQNVEIILENTSKEEYTICVMNIFELVNLKEIKTDYPSKCNIEKGESYKLTMKIRFSQYGAKIFPVVLKLSENGSEEFRYLLIEPSFNVVSKAVPDKHANRFCRRPLIKDLPERKEFKRCIIPDGPRPQPGKRCIIPDSVFSRNKNKNTSDDGEKSKWRFRNALEKTQSKEKIRVKEIVEAPRITREIKIPKLDLLCYAIPRVLNKLLKAGFRTNGFFSVLETEILKKIKKLICGIESTNVLPNEIALTKENYVERFHHIMWIEEFQALEEIKSYEQQNIHLLTDRLKENLLGINVPGLAEGRPSVMKGDFVLILPKGWTKKYEGNVHCVEEASVYVKINQRFYDQHLWKHPVNVEFQMNRTPLKMSHNALDKIKMFKMEETMFPRSYEENPKTIELKPFFNKCIESNELQVQAIENIVQNKAYPAPYILFGPPGTGKTATLVEAITQIWSVFDDSKICVCASSNTAADVIALRLLEFIPLTDIIRVYGLSRTDVNILPELKGCCNFDPKVKEVFFPSISELRTKRIVVMTPVTAGRLVLSGIEFDYLFMDEAGHTVEVDMLIPIVGFLRNKFGVNNGSLILAGDPKQLGPVVRSPTAIALGYGVSLLERLMKQCDLYQKDPLTLKYNPRVITKLVNNFRSHAKILHVPNSRFYDNELQAKGEERKISCLSQWKKLPVADFPIIFHSVKGKEERESNSPSYFNTQEVNVVEQYVKDLFNSYKSEIAENDIGIISPYTKQVLKIRQRLARTWPKINVASVEEFQGQERKIIIISTVRSRHELVATDYKFGLGFLKNEKRFNVAITRAMALLIVIGNPDILQCDPNWRTFLQYCTENASFVGESANGTVPPDFDPNQESVVDLTGFKI